MVKSELIKLLSTKAKIGNCREANNLCLTLWRTLSSSLIECSGVSFLSDKSTVLQLADHKNIVLRLALLADFYIFQKDVLGFDRDQAGHKLSLIRSETLKFLENHTTPPSPVGRPPAPVCRGRPTEVRIFSSTKSHLRQIWARQPRARRKSRDSRGGRDKRHRSGNPGTRPFLQESHNGHETDLVKWSRLTYSARHKSYHTKLINAFQVVKTVGHPTVMLGSEWDLSCYYKLALAYTTDTPLETAAGCIPKLRDTIEIFTEGNSTSFGN